MYELISDKVEKKNVPHSSLSCRNTSVPILTAENDSKKTKNPKEPQFYMYILHLLHSRKVRQPKPPKKYQVLIYSMHKANLSSMTDAVNISEEAVFITSFYRFILFFFLQLKALDAKWILQQQKSTAWKGEYRSVNISSCCQGPSVKPSISPVQHYSTPWCIWRHFSPHWRINTHGYSLVSILHLHFIRKIKIEFDLI